MDHRSPAMSLDRRIAAIPAVADVVLPCLDEAAALPDVLRGLPEGFRAIVVDNGSIDGSPEIAQRLGATVIVEQRRGYGAACHAGLVAAHAPIVAFADADASLDLAELVGLVALVQEDRADLVLGRRTGHSTSGWPWHARMANKALSWYLRHEIGLDVSDIPPMRVARREALLELNVQDRRSGYPLETLLRAARADWRIREQDITYRPRVGKSKVTGTVSGTVRAIKDMSSAIVVDRKSA